MSVGGNRINGGTIMTDVLIGTLVETRELKASHVPGIRLCRWRSTSNEPKTHVKSLRSGSAADSDKTISSVSLVFAHLILCLKFSQYLLYWDKS